MQNRRLILFFTFAVALRDWQEKGLLERETLLYKSLADRGWTITFFTYGDDTDHGILAHDGITVVPLFAGRRRPSRLFQLLLSFPALLRQRGQLKGADIIKTNQVLGGWLAVMARWLSGVPLLVRGGYEPLQFAEAGGDGRLRRWVIKLASRLACRQADAIIMATERDKAFVSSRYQIPAERITVNGNWIDTDRFRPLDAPNAEAETVFYIGRYHRQKNVEALIDAAAIAGLRLDLAGQCPPEIEQRLIDRGVKYRLLGVIPNDQLPAIYTRYPVFCMPSLFEGNPKTLLEAMACGVMIVGTTGPGIADILENIDGHIITAPDAEALAAGLRQAMADGARRQRFGAAARRYILDHHSLDAFIHTEQAVIDALRQS